MVRNHGGDPLGSILRSMGSHWGQKMGQNRKKLPCPKIRIFYYSARSSIWAKIDFMLMAPNHGGDPLGSILGPMGSHWGQKMGQNRKKLPCPKIRIFYYSAVIDLGKKSNLRLWRQITVGNTWGPSWGQWGPIGNKKWVKTVKNYHAQKFEIFTTPRSSIWAKNRIYGYGAKSRWGPLGSILGPMGSHWGQKMGQKGKELPCPKIRLFNYSAVIDLGKKSNSRLWRQITVGTP